MQRQKYLAERRSVKPDIEKGIYPFKNIKLSRADVEWLLATHGNGQGPIECKIESPRRVAGIDLRGSDLRGVNLHGLPLSYIRAGLSRNEAISATLQQRDMAIVHLQDADLSLAHLEGAYLRNARLEGANLRGTHLESANLFGAHLEGAYLNETHLEGASLRSAFFDSGTRLHQVILGQEKLGAVLLADVHWGDANLSLVDWGQVKALGDEDEAQRKEMWDGKLKDENSRAWDYQAAVRTNRQLAIILREQGLNEDASRFAYRAQRLQRFVFRRQKNFGQYFFSLFLNLLAGYGYKPWRSFLAYLLVIIGFAFTYHQLSTHLGWNEAFVISMTAFHGRGFFPEQFHPGDPQAFVAAIEAFVGLLIEVTFIATLTQRFFGK